MNYAVLIKQLKPTSTRYSQVREIHNATNFHFKFEFKTETMIKTPKPNVDCAIRISSTACVTTDKIK